MNTEVTEPAAEELDAPVAPVVNPFGPVVAAPSGTAMTAFVQREVAKIQVSRIMARTFPRDEELARNQILAACARESLAEQALYQYAKGGTNIEGASIHLARELARIWGNLDYGQNEVDRIGGYSIIEVHAMDMQSGTHAENRFRVRHWRDRQGGAGYAVTDERDVYEVIANMASRRLRACILAILPADVVEAAVARVKLTLATKVKLTPERLANMVEGFAKLGVPRAALEKRVQRRLDAITPALFVQLAKIFNSLKDDMSRPDEWFDLEPEAATPAATKTAGNEALKAKLEKRAKKETKESEP